MVPQFTAVKTLWKWTQSNSGGYYQQVSDYGFGALGSGGYVLDPLPGTNSYVGFLGFGCGTNPDTLQTGWDRGETCYNVFNPKGILYQYQILKEIKTANNNLVFMAPPDHAF